MKSSQDDRYNEYRQLPPEARQAVDAVIDLAKASFADRSLSEFPEVFNQVIETGEKVRELAISRLNEFLAEKPVILKDGPAQEFQQGYHEINKVLPMRTVCPTCEEPGRLAVKVRRPGEFASFQILHSGDGTQVTHSGRPMTRPETTGMKFTAGEKQTQPLPE